MGTLPETPPSGLKCLLSVSERWSLEAEQAGRERKYPNISSPAPWFPASAAY